MTAFSKFLAYEGSPAKCKICDKYSIELNGAADSYRIVASLGLLVFGLLSLFTVNPINIVLWLIFTAIFPFYSLLMLPLQAIEKSLTRKSQRKKLIAWSILILLVLVVGEFQ